MAAGTPIQLGSPINEAISRGSDRVFRAFLEQKNRELQQQQIDVQKGNLALGFAQQQSADRAAAFERFKAVAAILPPDSRPADYPAILGLAKKAFPEIGDQEFEAFAQIPWRQRTLQDAINEGGKAILDDPNLPKETRERIMNNLLMGQPLSGTELSTRDAQARAQGTQANMFNQGLEVIMRDPDVVRDATRVGLGMEPLVEIPGFPGLQFKSTGIANIWKDILLAREGFSLKMRELSSQQVNDIEKEVMDMASNDLKIAVQRPFVRSMIQAYNQSAMGDFEPGTAPIETLYNQSDPAQQKVIQAFIGAVDVGEDAWLRAQSDDIQGFIGMTRTLSDTRLPQEDVVQVARDLAKGGRVEGVGFKDPIIGRPRFTFKSTQPQAAAGRPLDNIELLKLGEVLQKGLADEETLIRDLTAQGRIINPEVIRSARDRYIQYNGQSPTIPAAPPPSPGVQAPQEGPVGTDSVTMNLTTQINRAKARIQELQVKTDNPGRNMNNQQEIRRLERQIRTWETALQRRRPTR